MATDLEEIVRELASFYDVTDKKLVVIGAGGGQLLEFARPARQVIAVDKDSAALAQLAARLQDCGFAHKFALVQGDVADVSEPGDAVVLEFCLHEMPDPDRALDHIRAWAPDLLVVDHAAGSPWSWCAAEDRQVEAAWRAVEHRMIRRQHAVQGEQRFPDHAALAARLASQGPLSAERIAVYRGRAPIMIPMPYRLALL